MCEFNTLNDHSYILTVTQGSITEASL